VITPNDVFSKITNNGTRAYCPKCDDKAERIQGTIQINADYAFCHKCLGHWDFLGETDRTPKVEYKLENTTPKVASKEVEKSGYADAREKFIAHWDLVVKELELPWNKRCLDMPIGIRRDDKKNAQLVFQIRDNHVKYHKGAQFGDAKCKVFETPHLSNEYLLICEGEKDVITAYCNGVPALTFTSGAGALPAEVTLPSQYNKVYIVYDNDEKGEEGAKKLAKRLFDTCVELYIMQWVDKSDRYDVTDWFNDGHTMDELIGSCVRFGDKPEDLGGMRRFSPSEFAKTFHKMPEPIIENLLFEKDLMGLAGGTNVGKSVMSMQLSACLAMGVPFMNFRIPKPRKVMHVQFELKDESFRVLIERTAGHVLEQYPVEAKLFEENCSILSSGQIDVFTDKWDQIDSNLTFEPRDVLVVDNLYTSTNKNVSKNQDVMDLLRKMVNLKNKHNVAIVIVSHHKKLGEASPLDVSHMLGGSAYTNHLDGIVQLASSNRMPGLKVMKITKVRSQNDLHGVPVGIKLHNVTDGSLYFEYMKPLPKNEMFWYTDPVESIEEKVLKAVVTDGHNFSSNAFASALESVAGLSSNNAVYHWLERMENQGLIIKLSRGNYRKLESELDGFQD